MNITIVFYSKVQYNTIRVVPIVKFVLALMLLKQQQKNTLQEILFLFNISVGIFVLCIRNDRIVFKSQINFICSMRLKFVVKLYGIERKVL